MHSNRIPAPKTPTPPNPANIVLGRIFLMCNIGSEFFSDFYVPDKLTTK